VISGGMLLISATDGISQGSFVLQSCTGTAGVPPTPADCSGKPEHTFIFSVLENQPPTAGEAYSLQLLGDSGFLELGQHLAQSGTLEFWTQLPQLSGRQTIFSASRRLMAGKKVENLGLPILALSIADGVPSLEVCFKPMVGGEQAFMRQIPGLANTQPQHVAITWRYVRAARGRAVYEFSVYRNCVLVAGPLTVEDMCATFGYADEELHFPVFGQRYGLSAWGILSPTSFATAHIAEVRLWDRGVASTDLCAARRVGLRGSEAGLRTYLPMGPGDVYSDTGRQFIRNRVPGGAPAELRCSNARVACPDFSKSRGYALRPSLFDLPSQVRMLETSAGNFSDDAGGSGPLPMLEVDLPAFDRDNYGAYDLLSRELDSVSVQITQLPDPSCGTLLSKDGSSSVSVGQPLRVASLPLRFSPTRPAGADVDALACQTYLTYDAVDVQGYTSPFEARIDIVVRVPGPRISRVELLEPGVSDDGVDIGDIIAITFDRPASLGTSSTRRLSTQAVDVEWRSALRVLNGTLGRVELSPSWSESGEILMLRIDRQVDAYFAVVPRGVCRDQDLQPIVEASVCSAAATELKLPLPVQSISDANSPEGCFYLEGRSVFLNSNALSMGKGAETSTPGFPRLPICMAPALNLQPGLSRIGVSNTELLSVKTAGVDSYPAISMSPVLEGSFSEGRCPNGTIFDIANASCMACGLGNFRSADGLECFPCSAGSIAPEEDMDECVECQVGTYIPPGNQERDVCLLASPGKYVDRTGALRDLDCPPGTVAESAGSSSCSRCPSGARCEDYLVGAEIAGVPRGTVLPKDRAFKMPLPGHFRNAAGGIIPCVLPHACKGWDFALQRNRCKDGMGGYMCQGCESGYWRPHDKPQASCSRCGWSSPGPFIMVMIWWSVIIWVIAWLSIDAACWSNMHVVIFRLMLNYYAGASVLSRLEEWELEAKVGTGGVGWLVSSLNALFRFDGGVAAHLLGLECWFGDIARSLGRVGIDEQWFAIQAKTLFWIVAPLAWPILLVGFNVCLFEMYTCWRKNRARRRGGTLGSSSKSNVSRNNDSLDSFVNVPHAPRLLGLIRTRAVHLSFCRRVPLAVSDSWPLIVVCQFMLLPTVLRQLAVVLTCDSIGEGESKWRLYAHPEVVCWRGEHLHWAGGAIAAVVVWGIVLPGLMAWYIWTRRARLRCDIHLRARIGFVSDGYEQRWAFWEGVIYARKLIIILISIWPDLTRQAEMAWYQVIGVSAVLLHYSCKPFDNRSGELLDRVELYGLCLFLLQVTFVQFVLLADPSEQYDLLAVLLSCLLISVASLLFVVRSSLVTFYADTILAVFLFALTVTYWFAGGPPKRELTAFAMLFMAVMLNACFVAWLAFLITKQIIEAVAEILARNKMRAEKRSLSKSAPETVHNKLKHSKSIAQAMFSGFFSRVPLPKWFSIKDLWHKIMSAHFDSLGALVWFDTETQELVLGLHPDRFANDKRISSYIRRKLVALGPFLSDEERKFIAMGLRDAFMHLIVECDMNTVHCSLLEFLMRAAFAWHRVQEEGHHNAIGDETPMDESEGSLPGRRVSVASDAAEAARFVDMLFDQATFDQGIRAADFQAQLDKFTKMSKEEVARLVDRFLEVHAERPP